MGRQLMASIVAPDTKRIDQAWPVAGLERIERCPYCGSSERTIAHRDVQDWSFYTAPGKWTYWNCIQCHSLYLSPRPTVQTLPAAYGSYYTHSSAPEDSLADKAKERLRNECWSHWLHADLQPRLHIPKALSWLVRPLKSRLGEPFEVAELVNLPKGRLLDVGCGHGHTLSVAGKLGWRVTGLETDPVAVLAARARGLDIQEGSYSRLADLGQEFDCVVCSHVLEHVHEPLDMLSKIAGALKPSGTLLLSLPNATSVMRTHFGDDWRGLEAPRHLSIPSVSQLEANLRDVGFNVRRRRSSRLWTAAESSRIRRRARDLNAHDMAVARKLTATVAAPNDSQEDFSQLVCVLGQRNTHGRQAEDLSR